MVEPRSVADLREALDAGRQVKYLCFWGHQPPRGAGVGPGCLSQWWPAWFRVAGIDYATAEHFMMAEKARLFAADHLVTAILTAAHPGAAKALGRQIPGFDEDTWAQHRVGIVVRGNVAKFSQHNDLRDYLLGTGDRVLVEASPRDRIWGSGLTADHPHATNPDHWPGHNLLGFALMQTRTILRSQT